MKTLSMFLVLSTLTIACSGGMPDASSEADEPSAPAAAPQSSPGEEEASSALGTATVIAPDSLGTPTVGVGNGGAPGTPASSHRHDLQ